jgi:hypothetical protein
VSVRVFRRLARVPADEFSAETRDCEPPRRLAHTSSSLSLNDVFRRRCALARPGCVLEEKQRAVRDVDLAEWGRLRKLGAPEFQA